MPQEAETANKNSHAEENVKPLYIFADTVKKNKKTVIRASRFAVIYFIITERFLSRTERLFLH